MKDALKGLFGSKKALAAMAGTVTSALVLLASKQGYGLDPAASKTLVTVILGIVAAYVLGQGAADWGKESAKVQTAAFEVMASAERLDPSDASEADDDAGPTLLTEEL